jgi:hypothetical protein
MISKALSPPDCFVVVLGVLIISPSDCSVFHETSIYNLSGHVGMRI